MVMDFTKVVSQPCSLVTVSFAAGLSLVTFAKDTSGSSSVNEFS